MGWLFSSRWQSREDMLAHLRSRFPADGQMELLRSTAVGNNHWYLARYRETGVKWIGLDLMQGHRGEWGYKDLDETCGPCEVNCPITYVNEASPTESEYALDWRQKVREHHAKLASRPKPVPGQVVVYGSERFQLQRPAGPRRGWIVHRIRDSHPFRLSASQLSQADVEPAPSAG